MYTRVWRKGNPWALLVEIENSASTIENSGDGPQKIKNRIVIINPEIPFQDIYTKVILTRLLKRYFHSCSIIHYS